MKQGSHDGAEWQVENADYPIEFSAFRLFSFGWCPKNLPFRKAAMRRSRGLAVVPSGNA
ncbi:hypothetical protein [Shinella sp. HZN7]|uniref:hypothetical protein n=1 Tax=Shinella sp. (strain HZN7) TaxID=879274 RepID=UPI000B319762|nr:hypothetical protein [Shinella sp. HZN7]